ncbi:uncharacterized protein LOC113513892 [Galleria mellonella]|uniref:Uncharacterized protein LOC113513892 n=1 Tax=Galleria mellonella TaxID=7137 RepID=A0A6J1WI56_GALME|nr:uncharacterized protein LOC113513892 [Galleria mellonella]
MYINIIVIHQYILLKSVAQNLLVSEAGQVTKSIEDMLLDYEDDKNSMIAITDKENYNLYEDFYDEMDNRIRTEQSMNMIFFGPPISFMRLDSETILHILIHTRKHLIPITRALLAWDIITDGKTAAYLQGREYLAFGSLLNVVPEEDLYYVNFGDPSVLTFFSKNYVNLDNRKFGILVASYRRYFGNRWYESGTRINELGYLLCGFPSFDLKKITPQIFKEINVDIFSKLGRCSINQTKTLYDIATHPDAYGKPYKWFSHEIDRLGILFICVPEDDISPIQLEAVSAISAQVMKKIDQKKLKFFTKEQILRMNAKTRRIYILRMQLRNSLDMSQITRRHGIKLSPSILLYLVNVVTLLMCI